MSSGAKQLLLVGLLAALVALPVVLRRASGAGGSTERAAPPGDPAARAEALARHGLRLDEVSAAWGLAFRHQAPTLDPKLAPIMPQVASMGAAVSVVDLEGDGDQDLYVTNSGEGSRNSLFRNDGPGRFVDVAEEAGLADVNVAGTGVSMGSVWGDYDNDGREDVLLYKWGKPELFRNVDGKSFERVTERAGLPDWINAGCAVWLDYDRDGRLDAFVAGYWTEAVDMWHLPDTKVMPESFEYANNGGRKYLLRNRGDGTFEDVTAAMGITSRRWTLAVAAGDLRQTGWPDIFLANDYGVAELYANQEGKGFVEIGERAGVGLSPKSGMNASLGDVMNQGALAIYVSNISEEGVLIQGNNLWVPLPGSRGDEVAFENMAGSMGVELGGWSFGAQFGDLDCDGHLDIYLANGYVSADPERSYWYDFSQVAGGHTAVIGDAANWPAMEGRSLSGYQRKKLWLNDGAGRFREVAQAVGARDTQDGRAVALADLDGNGTLDVVVANQRGTLAVHRTTVAEGRSWIGFALEGTRSNRSAIGASVTLHWDGQLQRQEVSGGSGYSAQSQRWLHFGLGEARRVERAEIRWPSGAEQVIDAPAPGKIHRVKEPEAPAAAATGASA